MSKVICLVGAGGKSTIMYELAAKYASEGKKVVVTTSTHIWEPKTNYVQDIAEARALWLAGSFAIAGKREIGTGKLIGLTDSELKQYEAEADIVLVEADGAKGKPCKVPRSGEPVILAECNTVIGVAGLDALGCSVESACFRIDEACALLGVTAEHILTKEDLVKILLSERGTRKAVGNRNYFIVLNKCDSIELREWAGSIKSLLVENGIAESNISVRGKCVELWSL